MTVLRCARLWALSDIYNQREEFEKERAAMRFDNRPSDKAMPQPAEQV